MTSVCKNILLFNIYLMVLLFAMNYTSYAQESIISLLKNELRLADAQFDDENYNSALAKYLNIDSERARSAEVKIKIARCYFFLHQYGKAASYYKAAQKAKEKIPPADLLRYAEALVSTDAYQDAILVYRDYLSLNKNDESILKKIWRLQNINFL